MKKRSIIQLDPPNYRKQTKSKYTQHNVVVEPLPKFFESITPQGLRKQYIKELKDVK